MVYKELNIKFRRKHLREGNIFVETSGDLTCER